MIVTKLYELKQRLLQAINHGELGLPSQVMTGLNLRMTEPVAAIACAQLSKIEEIIRGRRRLAHAITDMVKHVPWIIPPVEDLDCKHSYYVWAGRILDPAKRQKFCHELTLRGFPMRMGYVKPLHRLFRSEDRCPATDRIEDREIITYEVCAYDPKSHHVQKMREIVDYVAEGVDNGNRWKEDHSLTATVSGR